VRPSPAYSSLLHSARFAPTCPKTVARCVEEVSVRQTLMQCLKPADFCLLRDPLSLIALSCRLVFLLIAKRAQVSHTLPASAGGSAGPVPRARPICVSPRLSGTWPVCSGFVPTIIKFVAWNLATILNVLRARGLQFPVCFRQLPAIRSSEHNAKWNVLARRSLRQCSWWTLRLRRSGAARQRTDSFLFAAAYLIAPGRGSVFGNVT